MQRRGMSKMLQVKDFGTTAEWDQANGTLTLHVVLERTSALANYSIEFELTNPIVGQDAADIYVTVLSPGLRLPAIAATRVQPSAGDAAPLLILDLITKHISQSTPSARVSNEISLSLNFRAGLKSKTWLVVSGLTGSTTADTLTMPLTVAVSDKYLDNSSEAQSARAFNASGIWDKSEGSLTIGVTGYVRPHLLHVIKFTLQNPDRGQKPPPICPCGHIRSCRSRDVDFLSAPLT
jgi:hypothetical protein